jgi:hypothetical protein
MLLIRQSLVTMQCGATTAIVLHELSMSRISPLGIGRMSQISARLAAPAPKPLEGSVVQSIVLVDKVTRSGADRFEATSLPGHLLHLVVEGEIEQDVSGRKQRVGPGTAIWYYETTPSAAEFSRRPGLSARSIFWRRGCRRPLSSSASGR